MPGFFVAAGLRALYLSMHDRCVTYGPLLSGFGIEARLAVNFSTILSAVKPRDRSDQYVILAAMHSLNAETNSVTVKQISQVLKLHLGRKTPANVSASLRKYSSYVEPIESGPPLRWQLKPEGIAKLRALSDLALTVVESDTAFGTDIGIVCALEQPEFDAVREALGG
jgi:hypothetical protein